MLSCLRADQIPASTADFALVGIPSPSFRTEVRSVWSIDETTDVLIITRHPRLLRGSSHRLERGARSQCLLPGSPDPARTCTTHDITFLVVQKIPWFRHESSVLREAGSFHLAAALFAGPSAATGITGFAAKTEKRSMVGETGANTPIALHLFDK
ncbi:hypothetical protein N657DRAFT_309083 [Parathielavia appendiculata]|uniref:Uncharacterized protein n=1 Tax=Parathielavia appendiculata TaxID=2587402 RepID=A0AAN6U5Q0_9PEZI|nr:hypothetical protein N657DRAFT_309083 [Parathielavia appendiculata]